MNTKKQDENMEKKFQIMLAIIAPIMALAGVYLGNFLNDESWNDQMIFQQKKLVIERRLDLIERTAQVIGEAPGYDDLFKFQINKGQVIFYDNNTSYVVNDPAISIQLAEYKGRYEGILVLDGIYFGPKTSTALQNLSNETGPWWSKSREKTNALLIAMKEELDYGIYSSKEGN